MPSVAAAEPPRLELDLVEIDPSARCQGSIEACRLLKEALYHYSLIPVDLMRFWRISDDYWYEQIRLGTELGYQTGLADSMADGGFTFWHLAVAGGAGVALGFVVGVLVSVLAAR